MAINGSDILLKVNTGTVGVPIWTVVGSQRNADFPEKSDFIDTSSKAARAQTGLPGRYSASVTLDALYVPSDAAYALLRSAIRNATVIQVCKAESGVNIEKADAVVVSLGPKAPDQAEATVSVELTISGGWVAV